jgi:hypothetical protein
MKKSFVKHQKHIDWYVSQNPIEKYLKIDRVDSQTISKFVCINSEKHFFRKKTKQILKHQIG